MAASAKLSAHSSPAASTEHPQTPVSTNMQSKSPLRNSNQERPPMPAFIVHDTLSSEFAVEDDFFGFPSIEWKFDDEKTPSWPRLVSLFRPKRGDSIGNGMVRSKACSLDLFALQRSAHISDSISHFDSVSIANKSRSSTTTLLNSESTSTNSNGFVAFKDGDATSPTADTHAKTLEALSNPDEESTSALAPSQMDTNNTSESQEIACLDIPEEHRHTHVFSMEGASKKKHSECQYTLSTNYFDKSMISEVNQSGHKPSRKRTHALTEDDFKMQLVEHL